MSDRIIGLYSPPMSELMVQVGQFHKMCDLPICKIPAIPKQAIVNRRLELIREEFQELKDAHETSNIPEIADSLADLIYVIIGMALEYGIPLHMVWDAVQDSNMQKRDPITGQIKRREDGKILKPDGWKKPNVAQILEVWTEMHLSIGVIK